MKNQSKKKKLDKKDFLCYNCLENEKEKWKWKWKGK